MSLAAHSAPPTTIQQKRPLPSFQVVERKYQVIKIGYFTGRIRKLKTLVSEGLTERFEYLKVCHPQLSWQIEMVKNCYLYQIEGILGDYAAESNSRLGYLSMFELKKIIDHISVFVTNRAIEFVQQQATYLSLHSADSSDSELETCNRAAIQSTKKNKFSSKALRILRLWIRNSSNEFPTLFETHLLAHKASLTPKQVTAWFHNRRNRSQHLKKSRLSTFKP